MAFRAARRLRRFLLTALAGAALVVLLPAAPASAHAFLTRSSPADGAVLAQAPRTIRLEFSESVVIAATRIELVDSDGHTFVPTALQLVHSGAADDTEEPSHVIAQLPPLPKSAYRVSWQTLSSDDLHRTSGLLVFGVNAPVKAAGFVEPRPRAEEALLRWLLFVGLAAALGGHLVRRLYQRAGGDVTRSVRRCRRVSLVGAVGAAVLAAALLFDQVSSSGTSLSRLLGSGYGVRWSVREIGLLLLVAAAIPAAHRGRGRLAASLVWVGGAAACVGAALLGHSGSDASAGPTRWLADAAHLAAAATWSGALVLLVIVSVPQLRAGAASAAAGRAVLRGFGIPAATCVSVMVVTGIYLASKVVGSVDAALFTIYGRTLLLKLAVVCVAGLLALVNTMALHRRGARPTPRATVFAEGILAVAILALAAVLTSGQPAREPLFVATGSPATVPFVDGTVVDLQESLAVRPNQPGRNVVVVDVLDTRRPAPAPVRRVLLNTVDAGGVAAAPIAAARLADGRWSAAMTLESSGRTYVRITVQRAGMADVRHDFAWNVGGGASPTRSTVVSRAPLAVPLRTLALLVAVLLALAWGGFWCRRAARGRPHAALAARPAADHPDIAADSGIAADLVTASRPAGP